MAFKFPFTNYHELNLTWVLEQLKKLFEESNENVETIESYENRLSAVETELPVVEATANQAETVANAAATLAQTAKSTADTANENALTASAQAGLARQEAAAAEMEAQAATQVAQQAQATAQNFDGRITQAEADASEALQEAQSFENRVNAAINTANNAANTATIAQGIAVTANQNAAAALDKAEQNAAKIGDLSDLTTTAKNNLVAAINEAAQTGGGTDDTKAPLIVASASGNVASFKDGADSLSLKKFLATIVAAQDLHGQPAPYPAGGGKNLLDPNKRTSYSNGNGQKWYESDGFTLLANQAYTFSVTFENPIALYIIDKTASTVLVTGTTAITYTPNEDTIVYFQAYRAQNISSVDTFQLELGSSATSFAPYSNICPITGWTGMSGKRTGENILDNTGIQLAVNNLLIARNTGYGNPVLLKAGVTYTFYSNSPARPDGIYLLTPYTSDAVYNITNSAFITVTPTKDIELGINFYWIGGRPSGATALYCVVGASVGNNALYQGQIITVSWETEAGTVYGALLDVMTGEFTVTDAEIASYNGETLPGVWISDRDAYAPGTTPTIGAQVVYKLATPQTYQLDPVAVNTLLGYNNIFTDCGSVSVDYPADTKLYIDVKVAELQALILEI